MLCKCSGKYIDIYFILKITCCLCFRHVLILERPGIASPPIKDPPLLSAPDVLLLPTTTSLPFTPFAGDSTRRLYPSCFS